jgi:hypothetical protein
MGDRRDVFRLLVGKLEGKRALGSPRGKWEEHIKMNHQDVGYGGMDWIDMA